MINKIITPIKKHRKKIKRKVRQSIPDKEYWILMEKLNRIRDIIEETD